jgi:hypothetical protein
MPILNHLPGDLIAGGSKILQAGLEGGKLAVAYGKPALEKSVDVTVQVSIQLPTHREFLYAKI